jgi:hypothetical protein
MCTIIVAGALLGGSDRPARAAGVVLVMDRGGHVQRRVDRALPPPSGGPAEAGVPGQAAPPPRVAAASRRARAAAARKAPARTLRGELKRLLAAHQIDRVAYTGDRRAFDDAIRTSRRLRGTRRAELLDALANLHDIAARGELTASRLPQLFATLERNREWWTSGRLLSYGQRVEFSDSQLVWQYYPGEGIQLQVLGTFGKANGLWMAHDDASLRALLDEMISFAAERGGTLAWEYDFDFDGGAPPWTSAMSQATGIQALARAAQRLGEPLYLEVAKRALALLTLPPPVGVRAPTPVGARFLLYSFAPGQRVVNAFVQTLVGLYDYAHFTHSALAGRLFRAGDLQARLDVAASDTGAWSLYQLGGAESDLPYHELLRDFLANLCARTAVSVYCTTATRFTDDLREPSVTTLLTTRAHAKGHGLVRFRLSKVSRVGMTIRHGGKTVLSTSATVSRGQHAYAWKVPSTTGTYDVTLAARDLAGNVGQASGTIEVVPARTKPKP